MRILEELWYGNIEPTEYLSLIHILPDGLILLGLQKPFLFEFGGAELFSQRVAPGNINVRIDKALLLQLDQ